MIYPVTLSDRQPRFQGHWVIIDAVDILCARGSVCDSYVLVNAAASDFS